MNSTDATMSTTDYLEVEAAARLFTVARRPLLFLFKSSPSNSRWRCSAGVYYLFLLTGTLKALRSPRDPPLPPPKAPPPTHDKHVCRLFASRHRSEGMGATHASQAQNGAKPRGTLLCISGA
eukprot:1895331-Pyramimonas_sp.AAC.1